MNHKTLVRVAVVMIIVFGAISVIYPRIFAPKPPPSAEDAVQAPNIDQAPVAAPPPAAPSVAP